MGFPERGLCMIISAYYLYLYHLQFQVQYDHSGMGNFLSADNSWAVGGRGGRP
jgi:hypothetical protein